MAKDQEIEERITLYKDELVRLLNSPTYEFLGQDRKNVPEAPGVYIIYQKVLGQVVYIGESDNLRRRLFSNHRSGNRRGSAFRRALSRWEKIEDEKEISEYIIQNCSFKFLLVSDKLERKRFEHFTIAVLNPRLNDVVRLRIF